MSLPARFAPFASIILASAGLVTLAASRIGRLGRTGRIAALVGWLALHTAALATGTGGLVVSNVLVLGSGAVGAALLARAMPTPGALAALAVTASVVDVVSFSTGPTRWLLDSGSAEVSTALRYLAVSIPWSGRTVPVVGVGDLLIFGALFLALRELGHRGWAAGAVLSVGLLLALAVGLVRGGAFGIPFMAAGAVALSVGAQRGS